MIYLYCVTAMCEISLKNQAEAEKAILTAWKLAVKDELIEPFIELHGLLQGLLESCIRKENPEMYRKYRMQLLPSAVDGWRFTILHQTDR